MLGQDCLFHVITYIIYIIVLPLFWGGDYVQSGIKNFFIIFKTILEHLGGSDT